MSPVLVLQLQHALSAGVRGQVELVLLLQGRGDETPPEVVVSTPEVDGRLLGRGQGDEHVGLQAVWPALLHVPACGSIRRRR